MSACCWHAHEQSSDATQQRYCAYSDAIFRHPCVRLGMLERCGYLQVQVDEPFKNVARGKAPPGEPPRLRQMMLVLEQPLVFGFVMQCAEPDQWLFFGLVSKAWAALYSVVQHEQLACRQRSTIASAAGTKTTSYAAAAASLARAQSVCDWDAALAEKLFSLSRGAAFVGSSDVMAWAKATAGTKWLAWHH
eukprot:9699-Heterococcus_DN1.PRE.3